jgi:hypothetical protein
MQHIDPRWWQIASLSGLNIWGITLLDFELTLARAAAIIGTALVTQLVCSILSGLQFEWKSALISGLGICFLMRSNSMLLLLVGMALAISSKFLIRAAGKHIFNPTNFALVVMIAISDRVWVSPGQWGSVAFFAFLVACAGFLVVYRSSRSDITLAFLCFWAAILFGRSLLLGDTMSIPLHRLENGTLLIFAFFMISDPRSTPNTRAGRILFAALVAAVAWYIQFRLYRTNPLLWALFVISPLTPLIDRIMRGPRFEWRPPEVLMRRAAVPLILTLLFVSPEASAFCGFYVAKGDAKLFNRASQVVLVRDGDRTVMTMANDFKGDPREFAVVIPVPAVLQRGQIRVGDKAVIDHLDAYSAPRLVEYHDPDPCLEAMYDRSSVAEAIAVRGQAPARMQSRGVTIEARYTVGEYDILILSARESAGLEMWLRENGYRIPEGASEVLGSYIRQNLKFFVAKVNLKEQSRLGFSYLRPIQVAFESPRFMLPIRLGTVNADGPQDLFVYALTRKGRIETTNYRTVRLPSDQDIPLYVRDEFAKFYKAMFSQQVRREQMRTVFLEYAWDMNWCDPCAADPLSRDELKRLGVYWLADDRQPVDVFITRLHVRYDGAHFPDDLVFQETGDRQNFQARFVLNHPWKGGNRCPAADRYYEMLRTRREKEARNLAELTGWSFGDISKRMQLVGSVKEKKWWEW